MSWRTDGELWEMFSAVGKNVKVSARAVFHEPEKMRIGDNSRIDDFCLLSGDIVIGRNVHLAAYTHIEAGRPGVVLEDFSGCAYGCRIIAHSDDYSGRSLTNPTTPSKFKQPKLSPVRVGRHAILGAGTIVLPGGDIGEGAATGAGTVVTHPLAGWRIYVGQPARPVSERSRELLALERQYLGEEEQLSNSAVGESEDPESDSAAAARDRT